MSQKTSNDSEIWLAALSANGARYESQGRATKERRPWTLSPSTLKALKGRTMLAEVAEAQYESGVDGIELQKHLREGESIAP